MFFCVVFFFLTTVAYLHSAGPLAHLWAAQCFCRIHGIEDQKVVEQIILGTEFPDIRYITTLVGRDQTHPKVPGISDVLKTQTTFLVGE